MREVRPATRFGGAERDIPVSAPDLGADTASVLTELGFDAAAISDLRAAGAFGDSS